MSTFTRLALGLIVFLWASILGYGAQTLNLPDWICTKPDAIFISGFQTEVAVPHNPSQGAGGLAPGMRMRTVIVPGLGSSDSHNYYLYIPTSYTPSRSWPLLIVLHGVPTPPSVADMAADSLIQSWASIAETHQFIVVAPIASGNSGGWLAPYSPGDSPTDYDMFAAIIADMEAAYNIERTRRYGWGFSAGGKVMHDLMLNGFNASVNADSIVAYSVDGASAIGLACGSWSACDALLMKATRQIPVDIHIGSSDPWLSYVRDDHTRFLNRNWKDGQTIFYTEFNGGHTYTGQLAGVWPNLCQFALIP